MSSIESDIVPWALPREDIPFRFSWDNDVTFDRIQIVVPEDIEIKELINVEEFEINENTATIRKIYDVEGITNYFGCIISSRIIYDSLKIRKLIKVTFFKNEEIIYEKILQARIFRPLLELKNPPENIVIEEGIKQELPLVIRYVGFGDVIVKVEGLMKGRLVTKGKSFLYELLKRLIDTGVFNEDETKKEAAHNVQISPDFVKKTTQEMLELLNNPAEEIADIVGDLKNIFDESSLSETIDEFLRQRIEEVILGMISDHLERNPVSNVRFSQGETSISTVLDLPIELLELHIIYTDMMDNKYPIIKVPIKITNTTSLNKKTIINIPIKFENWEIEPFMNVKEMVIDAN